MVDGGRRYKSFREVQIMSFLMIIVNLKEESPKLNETMLRSFGAVLQT